jgi:hypothetical protein
MVGKPSGNRSGTGYLPILCSEDFGALSVLGVSRDIGMGIHAVFGLAACACRE